MDPFTDELDGERIGNTSISILSCKSKPISQRKNLFFTFNNYEESDITDLLNVFDVKYTEYIFQED